jgi:quinol monooxygenase YgiN
VVGIEILLHVTDRKRTEFLQAVSSLRAGESEEGLLLREAYEDLSEPGRFLWVEHWRDPELLQAHVRSERHRALLGAIRVLGRLEDVRFVEYTKPPSATV